MGTLYERLQELCKDKGVSGSRMCLDLGLSKSTMSDLKNGRIKCISLPTAQKMAGYFGISVDELYDGADKKEKPTAQGDGLSENQQKLIEFARSLSEDQAALALRLLKSLVEAD